MEVTTLEVPVLAKQIPMPKSTPLQEQETAVRPLPNLHRKKSPVSAAEERALVAVLGDYLNAAGLALREGRHQDAVAALELAGRINRRRMRISEIVRAKA